LRNIVDFKMHPDLAYITDLQDITAGSYGGSGVVEIAVVTLID